MDELQIRRNARSRVKAELEHAVLLPSYYDVSRTVEEMATGCQAALGGLAQGSRRGIHRLICAEGVPRAGRGSQDAPGGERTGYSASPPLPGQPRVHPPGSCSCRT